MDCGRIELSILMDVLLGGAGQRTSPPARSLSSAHPSPTYTGPREPTPRYSQHADRVHSSLPAAQANHLLSNFEIKGGHLIF
jgi:hypothetical protein